MRPTAGERPWPAPRTPWLVRMRWHELCFLHWPVDPEAVAPLLPAGIAPDVYDGAAWIGVVPFRMTDVAPRGVPRIRRLSDFGELNVRTYTTLDGKPGVWFFSLDATQPLAVRAARVTFHLPYLDARIELERDGDTIDYSSRRTHLGGGVAELRVRYRPIGPVTTAVSGSLESFLTDRYCLYAARGERIYRAEIDHARWPLQTAAADVDHCSMTTPLGIELGDEAPLAHYAESLDVVAWRPRRVHPADERAAERSIG